MNPFFLADPSVKGVPLQALPPSAWRYLVGQPDDDAMLQPISAYKKVAWVYRGVDLRAKAVQKMPYQLLKGGVDVSKNPDTQVLQKKLSHNLYRTEAALCLYGAAYWMLDTNAFGMNTTPRWLLPATIMPEFDKRIGLVGFKRALDKMGEGTNVPLDKIVYFWVPSLETEVGPGIPPAKVAMMAAGVLHGVDVFIDGFFRRGAIKAVILTVEGNPPPGEQEKLQAWWKRVAGGVRNAWNSVVVRSSIKPVVIGDGLKDTVNPQLTDQAREDVAAALGIPGSLLRSDALAGGTADVEMLNFYEQTVIPECDLIAEAVNEQWLSKEGYELKFTPQRLEAYQSRELLKASAISQIVGRPIMTVNEGRDWMGLTAQVGYNTLIPTEVHIKPTPDQLDPATPPDQLPKLIPAEQQKAAHLAQWERKAIKRWRERGNARATWESEYITTVEAQRITARLATAQSEADIKAIFTAAKRGRIRASDVRVDAAVIAAAARRVQEARG